jgi:5-oxoprolinase (ATP-hydrolysing)
MLNAPYAGGTHLPDITVVSPVFATGVPSPPSLSPRARTTPTSAVSRRVDAARLANYRREGVLFDNFLLVDNGRIREEACAGAARRGSVACAQSVAERRDLKAQLAGERTRRRELER